MTILYTAASNVERNFKHLTAGCKYAPYFICYWVFISHLNLKIECVSMGFTNHLNMKWQCLLSWPHKSQKPKHVLTSSIEIKSAQNIALDKISTDGSIHWSIGRKLFDNQVCWTLGKACPNISRFFHKSRYIMKTSMCVCVCMTPFSMNQKQ